MGGEKWSSNLEVVILDKWDKIEGKSYVIRDIDNKRVIRFGKYNDEKKQHILNSQKDYILNVYKNRNIAKELKIKTKGDNKFFKVIKTYKRKFPTGRNVKKELSWSLKRVKPNQLKDGDIFQVHAKCSNSDGEIFGIRSKQHIYSNQKDISFALSQVSDIIEHSKSEFNVDYLTIIKWIPSKILQETFGF